ncbi:MAG: TolC family protein [Hyphomicrobiales bacterium]|nr:TolC family protein [Hyphomicrobiales bacterium]
MLASTALVLSGCATYRPQPLDNSADPLKGPVVAAITQEPVTIDRVWLKPAVVDLARPLDGNAVAILTVLANPDLKALRQRAGVADAQVFAAGLLPDPTISVGASLPISAPDTLTSFAGALALDLNALRTRGVSRQKAQAESRRVRLDLVWSEWQTAGQARIQAARIISLKRRRTLETLSQRAAQSLLDRSLRAAGRGDLPADRVQAARIAAFDSANRLRTVEADLVAAESELTKLMGLPPNYPLRLSESHLPAPPPDTARLFAIALSQRADLQALRAGYAAQEAAVHKAVLDQFPNLTLSIDGNRDNSGIVSAGPSVNFTLPLWNRNRGGIAIELATRAALNAEYQARLFQTRAEIARAVTGLALVRRRHARSVADLAALRQMATASRHAADRGDLSLETAEVAEQTLRDRELAIAQDEQAIREQTIALELLTGLPEELWPR